MARNHYHNIFLISQESDSVIIISHAMCATEQKVKCYRASALYSVFYPVN